MAKKNNNNGVESKNKNNDGGEKKKDGPSASKIVKWVKSFQGAESVKSEGQANKLTVVGEVDPTKLRDELGTKTKNKVDLVSPQPKKDHKVNKDDANDTKKKQPEKTDNDEKPKEAPLNLRNLRVLNRRNLRVLSLTNLRLLNFRVLNSTNLSRRNLRLSNSTNLGFSSFPTLRSWTLSGFTSLSKTEGNDGNDRNDGNDGNGGGGGDEKKKEEDKGNGGGKMKYPAGQSGFGQFSYETVYRHGYGYQNGALKTEEKMLLLCCEAFGLLVKYNHLAKDIYTNVTLHAYSSRPIKAQGAAVAPLLVR